MNIIVITEKDAANASMSRIANAFLKKGHCVKVYAPYYDDALLKGFDKSILKFSYDKLDDDALDWCDVVFSTSIAAAFLGRGNLLKIKKPIFTHNYLINKQVNWGGDLCFVSSLETSTTEHDDIIRDIKFAVGEPKYDSSEKRNATSRSKKFLFIDSGHFPFGKKGKKQLADCLISICKKFPDYELVIKPRFLPGDKVITHRNLFTLYDALLEENEGAIPNNLIYLDKHYDLMALIEECDVVICLYTTAFVGAYVANKGLIVIDELDSDDVYDVRLKTFYRIRDNMICTNAIIPYYDVEKYLPEGVRADEKSMKYLFAEQNNVADKICETVEFLYDSYYKQGKFPSMQNYEYSNYKQKLKSEPNVEWEDIISNRIRNYIMQRMLIQIDFNLSINIDVSYIRNYVNSIDFTKTDYHEVLKRVNEIRSKCIIENRDQLKSDVIDSGVLLNAYYLIKEYDSILTFENKENSSYYLFSGFVYHDRKDSQNTINMLERYFDMTDHREYIKEISDMSGNRFSAFKILISEYKQTGENVKAYKLLKKMEDFYKINYLVEDLNYPTTSKDQKINLDFIVCNKEELEI